MSADDSGSEGRLIGLLLPVGIVFLALVVSNAMELGERVAQHKRVQASLTVVRQQVTVGQSKGRRLAEVGRAVLDLAPTNQYAAAIQKRFRIRPTGSRGEPAAVEATSEPGVNPGAASAMPPDAPAITPDVASAAPRLSLSFSATNAPNGSQFNLRPDGVGLPATPQR